MSYRQSYKEYLTVNLTIGISQWKQKVYFNPHIYAKATNNL